MASDFVKGKKGPSSRDCLKNHCISSFVRPYSIALQALFLGTVCLALGMELFALTVFYINYISTSP